MHLAKVRQILYGGAAGGGKSHGLRWDGISIALECPGVEVFLFRRTLKELEGTHIRPIQREIPKELGEYKEGKKRFEFKNGSGINFCYCEHENDVETYRSEEMHVLLVDEASQFTPYQLGFLKTRNRLGGFKPPPKYVGYLPRVVLASNPGGPSHGFLRDGFVSKAPAETIFFDDDMRDPKNPNDRGWSSIYIPAKMGDNKYLDADYGASFGGLPAEMQKAYRDGDWDAVVGAALESLSRDKHMIRDFKPPKHWTRFMSIDWGTAAPFSIGWYTVSEGVVLQGRESWPDVFLPDGALIRYAEFYGWNGKPNKGCRMESHVVAKTALLQEEERGDVMDYRIGDTQMWASDDGPSVAERMSRETDGRFGLRQAQKDRKANYAEILARLKGEETEDGKYRPMFYATEGCRHFWRTCPGLILDMNDPDKGPADKQEDHVFDEWAYASRSRPYAMTEKQRRDEEMDEDLRKERRRLAMDPYCTA